MRLRLTTLSAVATLLALVLFFPAPVGAQNPAGCNSNNINVTIERDKLVAVAGETVNYTVNIVNEPTVGGTNIGCNVNDVTANFYCPGATGASNGPSTNVVTTVDFPAIGVVSNYGPYACTMPNISDFAYARVAGSGILDDGANSPATISKEIAVTVQSCQVKVDKQVSCDGGTTWVDQGLVFVPTADGANGCTALDGTPILVRYRVNNPGQTSLYSCTLTDSNNTFGSVSVPTPIATTVTTSYILPGLSPPVCSDSFEAKEPDTATVNCFCTADLNVDLKVSAADSADVTCNSTPQLSVTKLCEDENNDGEDEITIEVCATAADLGLVNCTVTDNIYLTDPTCPADVGSATPVTVAPAAFSLEAGTCQTVLGAVTVEEDACNTVSVSCTVATTAIQRTDTADDVCEAPGEGCLTRTPGFWATHPSITDDFLPQSVCGIAISNVTAGSGHSAIEAMCSVGKDGKILGQQKTQLIRQCTAAYLNVTATEAGEGNCTTEFSYLTDLLDQCCSAESACTGDEGDYSMNECIEMIDGFNNSFDTLDPYGVFMHPGPADPKVCQDAKNNGVVIH